MKYSTVHTLLLVCFTNKLACVYMCLFYYPTYNWLMPLLKMRIDFDVPYLKLCITMLVFAVGRDKSNFPFFNNSTEKCEAIHHVLTNNRKNLRLHTVESVNILLCFIQLMLTIQNCSLCSKQQENATSNTFFQYFYIAHGANSFMQCEIYLMHSQCCSGQN